MELRKRLVYGVLIALVISAAAPAATLTITEGLASWQVLQCAEDGLARARCRGIWDGADGVAIRGRLLAGDVVVTEWHDVGVAASGSWEAVLEGIPAGGPYTVEFSAGDKGCTVEQVLAGDLWVLAGQSNMQGVGNMIDVMPPHPQVHALAMNGQWRVAEEPLHILAESPDPVHAKPESEEARAQAVTAARASAKGAGLGLPFAVEMVRRTGRPVGLVCTAHGGTSMDQWDPSRRDEGGESLYGSMYDQFLRAGGAVRGVLWYQGESDANPDAAALFQDKFEAFVAAVRSDFNTPALPFYYVQIGRFTHPDRRSEPWNLVQAMQLAAASTLEQADVVPSIDLELDDLIHIGVAGLKRLGARLANLAERDLFGGAVLAGPRPVATSYEETPHGKQIRLTFSGVNGRLTAPGRALGFSLSNGPEGPVHPVVFKIDLPEASPDTAVIWVHALPEDPYLWYGRGLDPCANITDEADMAVPVFGPIPVTR